MDTFDSSGLEIVTKSSKLLSFSDSEIAARLLQNHLFGRLGKKQLAISKLMHYKYQGNRPAGKNLYRWNTILNRIAILGAKIPDDLEIFYWEPSQSSGSHSVKSS